MTRDPLADWQRGQDRARRRRIAEASIVWALVILACYGFVILLGIVLGIVIVVLG